MGRTIWSQQSKREHVCPMYSSSHTVYSGIHVVLCTHKVSARSALGGEYGLFIGLWMNVYHICKDPVYQ